MKDTRFMERKCFVITSEALLEFMKEQKQCIEPILVAYDKDEFQEKYGFSMEMLG